jgi:uracil-DNA glycosylase
MSDIKNLGRETLGHLQYYRDLGVRLSAPSTKAACPRATPSRGEKKDPGVAPAEAQRQLTAPVISLFDAQPGTPESLEEIRGDLGDCRRCKLFRTRHSIVYGTGNPEAELMFVGEAPGADEDEQGLPFVGRAGQLLTKIIQAIDMRREDVYICNILKCRPPQNRNPESDEIAACQPFLFRQIASVRPRVICALGTFGAQTLLRTKEPISKLRGHFIDFHGAKFMATFHPAYLLRNPNEKRKVWEDVQKIRDYLRS